MDTLRMRVFVDTNILKNTLVERRVYRSRVQIVEWGGQREEVIVYEPYRINVPAEAKQTKIWNKDIVALCYLAQASKLGYIEFVTSPAIDIELMGLKNVSGPSLFLFGASLESVPVLHAQERVILGGGKTFREWTALYLESIKSPRFLELCRYVGAYQGENKPMNTNQGLDALHIWTAESCDAAYLLTMDYKLARMIKLNSVKMTTLVMEPASLLADVLRRIGFLRSLKLIFTGSFAVKRYLFSNRKFFGEGHANSPAPRAHPSPSPATS